MSPHILFPTPQGEARKASAQVRDALGAGPRALIGRHGAAFGSLKTFKTATFDLDLKSLAAAHGNRT